MGIKSFQGKFEKPAKTLKENIKVSDFMSQNLTTFHPDQSIPDVIEILIKNRISGGPVVNDQFELMGIISEGDCIKQLSDSQYYNMPIENITVGDCMNCNVETIDGNLTIFDAAKHFLTAKRRRFPIVEGKKLVGLISQKDILRAYIKMSSQTWDRNQ